MLICIEMLVIAIVHYYVFSHKPYVNPEAAQVPCLTSCLKMLDVRDVGTDMREQVYIIQTSAMSKLHKITSAKSRSHDEENSDKETVQDETQNNENMSLLQSSIDKDQAVTTNTYASFVNTEQSGQR